MKAKIAVFFLMASLVMHCACRKSCTIDESGVTLRIKKKAGQKAHLLRVQVLSGGIFHVSAIPGRSFSDHESLSVILKPDRNTKWEANRGPDEVDIATPETKIRVSRETGRITFMDRDGNILLQEKDKGREFSDTLVDGTHGYVMRQVFETQDGEALYGLGQHQSDEMNYRGKNEVLFQYNTKVSMPFLVSTKNYGILWDNYAMTRYGNPHDYRQLSLFKLTGKDGTEGGLTATYFENGDTGKVMLPRLEQDINYENLETVKNLPQNVPLAGSRVIWEGTLEAPGTAVYDFGLYYAGYTRVWIDGKQVVDRWRTAWNPNLAKFHISMKQGEKHTIRLEWKPDGSVSYIGLRVLKPQDPVTQNRISFWSEMGNQLDYYFVRGRNIDEVIGGYRHLTGKAQVMPKWAMGFWQSRERFKTQDELLSTLREFRKRHIPIDNIVLDWFYWPENAWGSHEFDLSRFPDPKEMVDEVHRLNAHLMMSVWPKFYHTTEHYKELEQIGGIYLQAVKDSVRDWVGKGYVGSFYDAYNDQARRLFWKQMHDHFGDLGIDAWWMDASEPDILSNASIRYRKELMNPTALGPSTQYFNAYALMNARGIYEGARTAFPGQRVFLLTRSGFPGIQRYAAATWSGDIATRWEDLRAQIPAGINYCMSGNPYWTMDIGGFCVENRYIQAKEGSADLEEWRELNVRWSQFGAFAPIFRTHGQYPFREVFNLAPENHPSYTSIVYYDRLRYRLMPYIYSLAGMAWLRDYTIMRGLAMDFPSDTAVLSLGDQYMFGPALLVCPVSTYRQRQREVYLPEGSGWYDFYTGVFIPGGQKRTVPAPYDRMPLFVKAGSILPVGPEMEFASEKPADPLVLYVYTGADGSFTLYEDEGDNYNYENGKYSTIPFSYSESAGELTVGDRKGDFPGMSGKKTFQIVWISKDSPEGIVPDRKLTNPIPYTGKAITLKR